MHFGNCWISARKTHMFNKRCFGFAETRRITKPPWTAVVIAEAIFCFCKIRHQAMYTDVYCLMRWLKLLRYFMKFRHFMQALPCIKNKINAQIISMRLLWVFLKNNLLSLKIEIFYKFLTIPYCLNIFFSLLC